MAKFGRLTASLLQIFGIYVRLNSPRPKPKTYRPVSQPGDKGKYNGSKVGVAEQQRLLLDEFFGPEILHSIWVQLNLHRKRRSMERESIRLHKQKQLFGPCEVMGPF